MTERAEPESVGGGAWGEMVWEEGGGWWHQLGVGGGGVATVGGGNQRVHTPLKKIILFLSKAGMSLNKHCLAGNNLIIPGQGEFG